MSAFASTSAFSSRLSSSSSSSRPSERRRLHKRSNATTSSSATVCSSATRENEDEDERPSTSASSSSSPSFASRRVVLGAGSVSALAMMLERGDGEGAAFAAEEAGGEAEVKMEEVATTTTKKKRDIPLTKVTRESLAFTFAYPTETLSGKPIPWSESRVRDTYSSSEPMSPDARQRIVHELISFKGPLTAVVTVGELPPRLSNKPEKEWTAKNVANAILADKATGRVASGQKISLAEVDNAVKEEKEDGTTYYYYEYISQGSPNSKEGEATTYRHARGVTAVRDGFAYSMSMSTPERFWDEMDEGFNQSIRAFSLDAPTKKYRKPGDEGLDILHVFD